MMVVEQGECFRELLERFNGIVERASRKMDERKNPDLFLQVSPDDLAGNRDEEFIGFLDLDPEDYEFIQVAPRLIYEESRKELSHEGAWRLLEAQNKAADFLLLLCHISDRPQEYRPSVSGLRRDREQNLELALALGRQAVGDVGKRRKSKEEKIGLIAAELRKNPNATSKQIERVTGIDASDVRALWGPIKKSNRRTDTIGQNEVARGTHCTICETAPVVDWKCPCCQEIISGVCRMCHYTQCHPEQAIP